MGKEKGGERRFIDTNIFIYTIQGHPEFGERSKEILTRVDESEKAVTSSITLAEVCWWLEKHKEAEKIREELELIFSIFNLEIARPNTKDFLTGAELTGELGIDFNDCLNIALMKRLGISEVYSNDTDFDKVSDLERCFD